MTKPAILGFCGFGAMGSSLCEGFAPQGFSIFAFDPAIVVGIKGKVSFLKSNKEVIEKNPDILILAIKPQYLTQVCNEIKAYLSPQKTLVVSICAGVPISKIESLLPINARVIRTMPNICCSVQKMASAACRGKYATIEDEKTIVTLFSLVGTCVSIANEELMHAVTGVSGSGPAYIFMIIEAMADGGVRNGLPRAVALELACHTVLGAAEMVIQTKQHPGVLKDQVCSPGGTTIAAVSSLEKNGLRSTIIEAVSSATLQSKELAKL
jgi:pyrroline-5-carboxylate reductase